MRKSVILVMLLSCLVISCSKNRETVRFGIISTSINHLPLTYAIHNGLVNAENIEFISFSSGWELSEALIHKRVDIGILPFTYVWTAQANGFSLKTYSSFERETDALVTRKTINKISELNNQKVGVLRASTLDVLARDLAKQNGVEFEIVPFRTPNEIIEALKAKQIMAGALYVPLVQKVSDEFHVLNWFSELYPGHTCCNIATNLEKSKHSVLDKLVNDLSAILIDLQEHPENYINFVKEYYKLTENQALEALKHTKFSFKISNNDKEFEQNMIESFKELEYIKVIPPKKDIFLD